MTDATQTHNGLRCSHMIRIDEYVKFMLWAYAPHHRYLFIFIDFSSESYLFMIYACVCVSIEAIYVCISTGLTNSQPLL